MKKLIGIALSLTLAACGGGGSDDKSVFSLWTRDADGASFDLSRGQFSTQFQISLFQTNGAQCDCMTVFVGDESAGSIVTNQCRLVAGNPIQACSTLEGTIRYTKNKSSLTLTNQQTGLSASFH